MKPTIKISFEDYKHYAILGLQEAKIINNQIDAENIEFKITRHDGDHQIIETPDFVELPLNIIK